MFLLRRIICMALQIFALRFLANMIFPMTVCKDATAGAHSDVEFCQCITLQALPLQIIVYIFINRHTIGSLLLRIFDDFWVLTSTLHWSPE